VTDIRVLIVDDHPAIGEALARRGAGVSDLAIAGVARTPADADAILHEAERDGRIDVVVCDVRLEGGAEGLELLARHGAPGGPRFLMLSAFDQPAIVRTAFECGAAGYLLKSAELDEIEQAIRIVAAGGTVYPEAVARSLASAQRPPSGRERQVISLVADGSSNDEIGRRLDLSTKTVESHLRRMFDRYGVLSRTELVVVAITQGWLAPTWR
jgi:DNA-binding NarL/FixJ family response regulator